MNAMAPPRTMLEVYRRLPEGTSCQLIHNQIIMSPAPTNEHQKVTGKLFVQLTNFVDEHHLGETRIAPFDVFFDKKNAYQPDIIFVSHERLPKFENDGFHGAPDLIIEILSPSTAKYDLEDKKDVYEQYGVQEYWIVDPSNKQVWGYQLVDKYYQALPTNAGTIDSFFLKTSFTF
jgi:Uma2 family endonuclease